MPGQDLNLQIACSKEYTTYGGSPNSDACPSDAGSYHAGGSTGSGSGWGGNSEDMLTGCALAIAFKSNPQDVQPEDFTVMSIQERCVRQRDTSFAIPSNLPACPDGECTCAWFWQGKNSADEMYMTAFRCNVQGGSTGGIPSPVAPRIGQNTGATQPIYWANDRSNLDFTPGWENKPTYNSAWGWTNGAQTGAFGAATGNAGGNTNATPSDSTSSTGSTASTDSSAPVASSVPVASSAPTATQGEANNGGYADSTPAATSRTRTRTRRPQGQATDAANTPTWYNHAVDPVAASSSSAEAIPTESEAAQGQQGEQGDNTCRRRKHRSRAHVA